MKMRAIAVALACLTGSAPGLSTAQNMFTDETNISTLQALGGPTHAAQARELIIRAGYSEVDDPKREGDGTWQAMAVKQDRRVRVTIDRDGNVKP